MEIGYDIEEMRKTQKEMEELVSELENTCKECYRRIDETKEVFDTPTAEYFREKATECVLKSQKNLEGKVEPLITERLEKIIVKYEETIKEIGKYIKEKGDTNGI